MPASDEMRVCSNRIPLARLSHVGRSGRKAKIHRIVDLCVNCLFMTEIVAFPSCTVIVFHCFRGGENAGKHYFEISVPSSGVHVQQR